MRNLILKKAQRDPEFRRRLITKLSSRSSEGAKILQSVEQMVTDPIEEGEFDFQENKRLLQTLGGKFGKVLGQLEADQDNLKGADQRVYDKMDELYTEFEKVRIVMKPFLDACDNEMEKYL